MGCHAHGPYLTPDLPAVLLDAIRAVAVFPQEGTANDGKIVEAGGFVNTSKVHHPFASLESSYAVVCYNLNGTLDRTFGVSGQATTNVGASGNMFARAVAVQPDGKILAAGYPDLIRYTANGTLDTTFGANGEVVLPFTADSMSLQPDGKIVVVGTTSNQLSVARYNANGSLDASFGKGGTVMGATPVGSLFEAPTVALDMGTSPLDPDAGKIVVVGEEGGAVVVVRFNTDCSLDTSFGQGGTSSTGLTPKNQPTLAVQSDDRIVMAELVVSGSAQGFGLYRFNPDGTPDSSFGSGGLVNPTPATSNGYPESVTVGQDGKILVAGSNGSPNLLVARYNAGDGSLDTSFGTHGVATAHVGSPVSIPSEAMAVEPDGRLVVGGTGANSSGATDFLVRFLAGGPEIGSLTAVVNPAASGGAVALTAAGVLDPNPGSTITQVSVYMDANGDGILEPGADTLLGTATLTGNGTWVFTTAVLAPGTYTFFAVAEDSYGVLGDSVGVTIQVI
jgi:uncharacterized delta-60 repeat protein